jgi:hypothetical protein
VTDAELAWVAGLLEGEGSFGKLWGGAVQIVCCMTDEDVVRKLQAVTRMGRVNGPYRYTKHKPQWRWTLTVRAHTTELMERLLPHMGIRRREEITELLAHLEPYKAEGSMLVQG